MRLNLSKLDIQTAQKADARNADTPKNALHWNSAESAIDNRWR